MLYTISWLLYKGSDGISTSKMHLNTILFIHQCKAVGEKDLIIMCTRWRITHIPVISPIAACTVYITYRMTEMQWLREVKWQFNFDHTTLLIYIWINLWLHQMNFQWKWKKMKTPRSEYISTDLEAVPPSLPAPSLQFTVSLFKVKMKIGARSICIWTKRESDYECSKPNFYYTSIILLLITDSFSLCSSSKTHSYSIHVHTREKKKLARLSAMFNLWRIFLLVMTRKECVRETKVYVLMRLWSC